jgi:hypothetical protein
LAPFEHGDRAPGIAQCGGAREASHAGSDDRNVRGRFQQIHGASKMVRVRESKLASLYRVNQKYRFVDSGYYDKTIHDDSNIVYYSETEVSEKELQWLWR